MMDQRHLLFPFLYAIDAKEALDADVACFSVSRGGVLRQGQLLLGDLSPVAAVTVSASRRARSRRGFFEARVGLTSGDRIGQVGSTMQAFLAPRPG